MNNTIRAIASLLLFSYLTGIAKHSLAQPITPASDGTGTTVTPEGKQFNIHGGQRSENGANLFHSFEKFGLDAGQVANFLSHPEIQNILGRVTGGDPSIINGLIQVTGGDSNLYLMNPAGILFGANASLNVPADFFATSATGIGFGEGNWFHAIGENNWANLVGEPSQFAFSSLSPGAIVNFGNLTLQPGQNLTLLGGTVLNRGTLSAPGGKITLSAVPGESSVRISQENHLLSLEVKTGMGEMGIPIPQSLPELLTGAGATHAENVTVNPDGSIQLSGSGIRIDSQTGDAIASGDIDASRGEIAVLGNRVAVIDGDIDASGINGGGSVLIGGDLRGKGTVPNALQTFVSNDSTIAADATEFGDGGRVIIFAEETARIGGEISARGGILGGNGGFIETSGLQFLEVTTVPNASTTCSEVPTCGMGGEWLIDPYNIDIVAGAGNVNINNANPFAATGNTAQLGVDLIVAALSGGNQSVTIETGAGGAEAGNITVSTPIDFHGTGANNTLTLNAHNDITINANITDSVPGGDSLNVALNADSDNANGGGIAITNATINTGGGNFTATGTGSATLGDGIHLDGGTINAGGGNITLTGTGLNGGNNNSGIVVDNGSVLETTGNGTITLQGTGGTGTEWNIGLLIENATLSANTDITLIGNGANGTNFNPGIFLDGTTVSSGTGNIRVTGTGGNSTGFNNIGIWVQGNSHLESGGGLIALEGTGGSGTLRNNGMYIGQSMVLANADITLTGNGGNGVNFSRGIFLDGTTVRSNTGNIRLTGTGGNSTGEFNPGIAIENNTRLESGGGTITLEGEAIAVSGTRWNGGIVMDTFTKEKREFESYVF